ncbi:calponin-like domain-containing protein [Phthorimaea operculella]|nr:calponin-like domain-containing protein [Phthorimaea operculella]
MIPTCIRAPRSIQGSTDDVTRQTRSIVQIYTDWANHYLERARSRRRAGTSGAGLARDCADGLLLADVLEGVTGLKVPRAHRKPRNPQQMLENVQCCLDFLHAQKVQGLEQVTAVDIRDAKLKAVLALFFALSRHKQATKQRTAPPTGNATNAGKGSGDDGSLSSVQRITGGSSDEILTACGNSVEMTTLTANSNLWKKITTFFIDFETASIRTTGANLRGIGLMTVLRQLGMSFVLYDKLLVPKRGNR